MPYVEYIKAMYGGINQEDLVDEDTQAPTSSPMEDQTFQRENIDEEFSHVSIKDHDENLVDEGIEASISPPHEESIDEEKSLKYMMLN